MSKAELLQQIAELQSRVAEAGQARTAMLDIQERLRAVLQTAVEGIITIDDSGIIETVNPAAESIFGYTATELVGKNVNVLMPSPYHEQHDGYLANYRRTGQRRIIGAGREVVGRKKDGSVFPMDLSVSELRLASGGRMFTGIVRDITERKRLEKEILEISEQERQRIGRDLHDDLGQRLTAIELLSQALEQDLAGRAGPEAALAAKISLRIREAIVLARGLAHGLTPVELQADGLTAALEELCVRTGPLIRGRCVFETSEGIVVPAGDVANHLYRIAQEAIANAIKHGKAQNIRIALLGKGNAVTLAISDDGTGLPPGSAQGRGRGLSIMQYRASILGATLEIRNNAHGPGATVTCDLSTSV